MHAVPEMIHFENLTKRYGAARRHLTPALQDVTLHLPRGTACAVVGPNGAGKSTMIALTLGFLRPTNGAIRVGAESPRAYIRRNGAGYLPERFGPSPAWRVHDALHAFARIDGVPASRADEALEEWGLTDHAGKELGELSRGLLQRVGLALALLAPRELVILDEPHEGLDPLWRVRLREVVLELHAAGRTILIASHDLAEVERMTQQAVLLEGGRVRDVLETAAPLTPTRYRVRLATPNTGFAAAFGLPSAMDDVTVYDVDVRDADELSARLAAAITGGARIVAVEPHHEPLEERVRRALGEENE